MLAVHIEDLKRDPFLQPFFLSRPSRRRRHCGLGSDTCTCRQLNIEHWTWFQSARWLHIGGKSGKFESDDMSRARKRTRCTAAVRIQVCKLPKSMLLTSASASHALMLIYVLLRVDL
jgi:hypothetical protein